MLPGNQALLTINMYGQPDYAGFYTPSVHHMISDITAQVFSRKKKYIVVAGDLNASVQWDEKYHDPAHKLVFDRLDDLGLVNCTKETFGGHIQTHKHSRSDFPWQNDYIFLNKNLYSKLLSCSVHNEEGMLNLSDHFPVEIILDI
jgi:endonuclease/exonuclease/phosphatase family metal-dependent hydrolase